MLETIRAFGLELLAERGEERVIRDRHAAYFQELAQRLQTAGKDDVDDSGPSVENFETHHANFEVALDHLEVGGEVERLLAMASDLHWFWLMRGYAGQARQRLERALPRASDALDELRAAALVSLAGALFFLRHEEEAALAMGERAIALGEASEATRVVIEAAEWCGMSAYRLGRPEEAQLAFAKGLAAHAALPDAPSVKQSAAHHVNLLGYAALAGAHIDEAERHFRSAVEQHRDVATGAGPAPNICYPLSGLGDVARFRDDHDVALAAYQEALRHAQGAGDVSELPLALVGIGGTLAAVGRWREAAPLFGATEALCDRTGYPFDEHPFLWQRALGLPEPWQRGDEPFGAGERLRAAVTARGMPALPPIPDPGAAADLWAAGRAAPLDEAIASALAVDLALPPTPVPTRERPIVPQVDPFDLTSREQEVLALLCQRLTDAEIGERLFISPRTASRHVANLFLKLEVANRREAAAFAVQHGLV
jgi:DNA-binding CsgD family transcriptional regulator/tetratricopeptide (TPR) repeat protein